MSYDCRKKVADKRLRIKGRFIKKEDQQELIKQILWNQNVLNVDVQKFNSNLKQVLTASPNPRPRDLKKQVKSL